MPRAACATRGSSPRGSNSSGSSSSTATPSPPLPLPKARAGCLVPRRPGPPGPSADNPSPSADLDQELTKSGHPQQQQQQQQQGAEPWHQPPGALPPLAQLPPGELPWHEALYLEAVGGADAATTTGSGSMHSSCTALPAPDDLLGGLLDLPFDFDAGDLPCNAFDISGMDMGDLLSFGGFGRAQAGPAPARKGGKKTGRPRTHFPGGWW